MADTKIYTPDELFEMTVEQLPFKPTGLNDQQVAELDLGKLKAVVSRQGGEYQITVRDHKDRPMVIEELEGGEFMDRGGVARLNKDDVIPALTALAESRANTMSGSFRPDFH